jgi:HEAT repeat protein/uncharacterized protein YegL
VKIYDRDKTFAIRSQAAQSASMIDCPETALVLFRMLAGAETPLLRSTLSRCVGRLGSREAVKAVMDKGLAHRDPGVREVCALSLGALGWEGALGALISATKDRQVEVRLAAIEALGRLKTPKAVDALLEAAGKAKGPVLVSALWALEISGSSDSRVVGIAASVLEGGKPVSAKVQAVNLLGSLEAEASLRKLLPLLKHKEWRLRAATISALAAIRSRDSVEPLIARLDREKGRLVDDLANALHRITGLDIGYDAKVWREWWAKNKDTFEPPPLPEVGKPARDGHTVATYHRIPIVSNRIVFLLDVSSSMITKMEATARRTGEGGAPKGDTRLDYCKWELDRVIRKLAKNVRFNIITFETNVHAWQRGVVPNLPANREEACGFVEKQRPLGGTGLGGAMKRAFQNLSADTFFVLSDGSPTDMSTEEILRWVSRTNGSRMIKIHTISVGELATSDFLKRLAEGNGGRHVVLK